MERGKLKSQLTFWQWDLRMEILNSPAWGGVRILGSFDYSPNPWNPSLAIKTGSRNERDSSESDLPEFESITMQSRFNFQAILILSLKCLWEGRNGMGRECKHLEYQGELHHFFFCAKWGLQVSMRGLLGVLGRLGSVMAPLNTMVSLEWVTIVKCLAQRK